jgi:RNA polymerase sigma-70 factor (ECF subfamily)
LRAWVYTLARNTANSYCEETSRERRRHVPLSDAGPLSAIAERIRTETLTEAKSEAKAIADRLRRELSVEDQTVLLLRVDRKLSWRDIAYITLEDAEHADAAVLNKEVLRVRKRYQLAKERLRRMAIEQGYTRRRNR